MWQSRAEKQTNFILKTWFPIFPAAPAACMQVILFSCSTRMLLLADKRVKNFGREEGGKRGSLPVCQEDSKNILLSHPLTFALVRLNLQGVEMMTKTLKLWLIRWRFEPPGAIFGKIETMEYDALVHLSPFPENQNKLDLLLRNSVRILHAMVFGTKKSFPFLLLF